MEKHGFFDVPRTAVTTSEGELELPMLFYDVSVRHLNFWVDYDQVLPKLAGTGLAPYRFFNGKAVVSLIFYQYRDVSIGGYDEVTITIVCLPETFKKPRFGLLNFLRRSGAGWTLGAYVLEMPVTIPAARAAGREIWGFPKFETKIPFRLAGREFEFGVMDPETDESIVSVQGKLGPGFKNKAFDLVTFSNLDGKILKTIIDVQAVYKNCLNGGVQIAAGPSSHGMAQTIRDLGLEQLQPFAIQSTDSFRSRLNAGHPVTDWPTPPLPYFPKKSSTPGPGAGDAC